METILESDELCEWAPLTTFNGDSGSANKYDRLCWKNHHTTPHKEPVLWLLADRYLSSKSDKKLIDKIHPPNVTRLPTLTLMMPTIRFH
jgi:hypothetical protein